MAKPTTDQPFYWIKVMEDNGTSYYTHFNFFVTPKPFKIKYYDTIKDTALDLEAWQKAKSMD